MTIDRLLSNLIGGVSTHGEHEETVPQGDSVSAFALDLKERLLAGRYNTVKAFAGDYALTGMSRSTVYSALGGTRLPTAVTITKLLSTVAGADDAEIRPWIDRRSALDHREPDPGPAPRRSVRPRNAVATMVGVAVTSVLSVGITLACTGHPESEQLSTAAQLCSPLADPGPHQVTAHVANTEGEGIYARIAPHEGCHTGFLAEAQSVTVVCQDLHGPTVIDVHAGTARAWPVWDKLGSGAYVSDVYLDLPKATQPALVDQLPAC
jgi:predicted DNA-binding transcriptional regulator AlpA